MKDISYHLNGSLLDVGAGKGPYRRYTSCEKYTSLESNPDLNPTVVGTADQMPFNDSEFDSILYLDVFQSYNKKAIFLFVIYLEYFSHEVSRYF